uniref:Uncharacterized protein n=1 Tax=candidate division WOR-3 bacterium TaxID=2052148 RepID=A0A7C4CCS6_UNCW3
MPRRRSRPLLPTLVILALAVGLVLVLRPRLARPRPAPPPEPKPAPARSLDPALAARLEPLLDDWLARWRKTDPGFSLARLRALAEYEIETPRPEPELAPDSAAALLRRREAAGLISHSPDRSRYIDLNAYAEVVVSRTGTRVYSEPDQLVELVDLRRRTRTRLAFHGTASATDAARWLDDSTVVLCGSSENPAGARSHRLPELRLARLNRRTVATYTLP